MCLLGALCAVCPESPHGHHDLGDQLRPGDGLWLHRDSGPTCILLLSPWILKGKLKLFRTFVICLISYQESSETIDTSYISVNNVETHVAWHKILKQGEKR